jgi:hypothetical protein
MSKREQELLLEEYEDYFDMAERANRRALTFEAWLLFRKKKGQTQ